MDQIVINGKVYDAGTLLDKTLVANSKIPVYRNPEDNSTIVGYIAAGQPVGVVYYWLGPNPAYGRSYGWFGFQFNGSIYYTKQSENYSLTALRQQGVLTTAEIVQQQQDAAAAANRPWYENLIRQYGLYVLGTVVVISIIKKKL